MPDECPECGKKVSPEATACPYCPASFHDEDLEIKHRKSFIMDPMGWPPAVWALLFVLFCFGAWRGINGVMNWGEDNVKNPFKRFMDSRTTIPNVNGPDQNPGQPQRQILTKDIAPGQGGGSAAPAPEPEGEVWRFNGTVYDLVTLAPIPNCGLVFANSKLRREAQSSDAGVYSAALPPLARGGYAVRINCSGYSKSYLNPGAENVPQMSEDDRKGLAHDLVGSNEGPYQVEGSAGEVVTTNFFLAPRSAGN